MASLVLLEYPNGRRHATVLEGTLETGAEFELYGRRWHALGPVVDWQTRNQPKTEPQPILCKSLEDRGAANQTSPGKPPQPS
jgi:hypothetical protein